jgi:hypothetical protein
MDGHPLEELFPVRIPILMAASGDDAIADEFEHFGSLSSSSRAVLQLVVTGRVSPRESRIQTGAHPSHLLDLTTWLGGGYE